VTRERITKGAFLVLGRAGLDLYADPPGTHIEEARAFFPALGGSAANIASAITRLGSHASLVTTASDDAVGRYVVAQLKHYGVATNHVRLIKGEERTSLAVVETRAENCQSVLYRNNAADFALTKDDVAALHYQSAAALIVTGTSLAIEPSRGASFEAIKRARASSCPVILDVDYRPYSWSSCDEATKICGEAARQADILIGNDEEFAVLAGQDNGLSFARALADEHRSIVVYKRGEKGLIAFVDGETIEMGIYPVKALKPTGAGDAFMGGFVTGLAQGLKPKDSLQRGAASAALVVTRVGCSPANPNEEDLQNFIRSHHINQ
jgi:5-dehydro-2-deoxygluconokinase